MQQRMEMDVYRKRDDGTYRLIIDGLDWETAQDIYRLVYEKWNHSLFSPQSPSQRSHLESGS